ncbi:glycoside hydrolase family 43 protein [Paramyrothecium foliicola]|nr:glycoside hydrolase family 43 protein [Paramyrothecium foliicola]
MQFSTTTFALLSLIASPLVSAGCYNGGAPWPNDHAGTIVAIENAAGIMERSGNLPPGEHPYDQKVGDKCIHFILDNISGSPRSISKSEAIDGWAKEYRGCANGGDTSYTNWRYVMDPNEC